jgi:hypothetical protein
MSTGKRAHRRYCGSHVRNIPNQPTDESSPQYQRMLVMVVSRKHDKAVPRALLHTTETRVAQKMAPLSRAPGCRLEQIIMIQCCRVSRICQNQALFSGNRRAMAYVLGMTVHPMVRTRKKVLMSSARYLFTFVSKFCVSVLSDSEMPRWT